MQLTAVHYAERPEPRDKVTSSHRRMVSAGPGSSHSTVPSQPPFAAGFPPYQPKGSHEGASIHLKVRQKRQ